MTIKKTKQGFESFSVFPAFSAGLVDGVNPVAILVVAVFLFVALFVVKNIKEVKIFGISSLATIFGLSLISLWGLLDVLLISMRVQFYLRICLLVIAALLIIAGVINFIDWYRLTKGSGTKGILFKWPRVLFSGKKSFEEKLSSKRRFLLIFWGISLGMCAVLLASLWPPQTTLTVLFYELILPGKSLIAFLAFFFYVFAYMMPLLILSGLIFFLFRSKANINQLKKALSKVKIITSAVYLAVGLGTFYLFY